MSSPSPFRATSWRIALALSMAAACAPATVQRLHVAPVPGPVDAELFLLGDGGDPGVEPVIRALTHVVNAIPQPRDHVRIVFLGDNVYPRGLPDDTAHDRREKEGVLDAQIAAFDSTGVRGFFVPGNHDWNKWRPGGLNAILRQQRYIDQRGNGRVTLVPRDGCPGPRTEDVGQTVRLLMLDTQWWLQEGTETRPSPTDSICGAAADRRAGRALRAALQTGNRYAIILAHHPLETDGRHGGYYDWRTLVFPGREYKSWLLLPVPPLGFAYASYRQNLKHNQDLVGPLYVGMRAELIDALAENPPLVYGAGHDHDLEVISGGVAGFTLISGTAAETKSVHHGSNTLYARSQRGFMRLTFAANGWVRLAVYVLGRDGEAHEDYSAWLIRPPRPMYEAWRAAAQPQAAPSGATSTAPHPR